jgi:hypothetical protein
LHDDAGQWLLLRHRVLSSLFGRNSKWASPPSGFARRGEEPHLFVSPFTSKRQEM